MFEGLTWRSPERLSGGEEREGHFMLRDQRQKMHGNNRKEINCFGFQFEVIGEQPGFSIHSLPIESRKGWLVTSLILLQHKHCGFDHDIIDSRLSNVESLTHRIRNGRNNYCVSVIYSIPIDAVRDDFFPWFPFKPPNRAVQNFDAK